MRLRVMFGECHCVRCHGKLECVAFAIDSNKRLARVAFACTPCNFIWQIGEWHRQPSVSDQDFLYYA
jgi:hypothetical protein